MKLKELAQKKKQKKNWCLAFLIIK